MKSSVVRRKYLEFFKSRGHKEIPSASLVPENDPTTLFTSSGMQPLVPYLLGEKHPEGKRLVNSQKCFRAQDIEEVGDNSHTTFFEMLGNWSLGDYFKNEQLGWIWEFLTETLEFPKGKLYVSIFEGNTEVPRDEISYKKWLELGIPKDHIFEYDVTKNWWSRSGTPNEMPPGEPGGPSSEVFFEFDSVKHDPKFGNKCHPNCQCGRFMEIGNSVFMQYKKQTNGKLEELPNKNVDFGGGLERLVAATENDPDMFKIDSFFNLITKLEELTGLKYTDKNNKSAMRVIADHIKAATFLIVDGVIPLNKGQGYILRRLLRRASVKFAMLRNNPGEYLPPSLTTTVLEMYDGIHNINKVEQESLVYKIVEDEIRRFQKTLHAGLKIVQNIEQIDGKFAFNLYQTFGFPLEVTLELLKQKGKQLDVTVFHQEFEKHKELSRSTSKGMFKGGLADHSEQVIKLHTATHLLHQALRTILGIHVVQKGSNITGERLRFDFSHPTKLTTEVIKEIEDLVNEQIKKDLPVSYKIMTYDEAIKESALAFFGERYPEKVKVYSIGSFSKEICGGPHVDHTAVIGKFKITKDESLGSGTRRIYAVAN